MDINYKAICFLLCISCALARGDSFRIDWSSLNSAAGRVHGGNYCLAFSIGQVVAGFALNDQYLHWTGFWALEAPNPVVVDRIGNAKALPDGTYVSIVRKIATTSATDFTGFFYVEEEDRSSGLLIVAPMSVAANLTRGSSVSAIGMLGTTPSGERFLTAGIVIITNCADSVADLDTGRDAGDSPNVLPRP